jgi:glycosyltransferase involved in cell wall biosynthesis
MDKNKLLVSVCCLTYNHEAYVEDCLIGILDQKTNFKYELLIHDDASTDGTKRIIEKYQLKHPEVVKPIYQNQNQYSQGIKPTFEYNFPRARGKYIAMCEGDDYWTDPLKLQKQVDFLEANQDYSLVFHNALIKESDQQNLMLTSIEKTIFFTEDIIKNWFIPTASILFRRYSDFKFPEWSYLTSSNDRLLLLLLSLNGPFKYLDESLCIYRKHADGISNTHTSIKKVASMVTLFNGFNQLSNYKYNEAIEQAISKEIQVHLPAYRGTKAYKE